jgi:glycosyltransferase involved in cell wall biosynthesis
MSIAVLFLSRFNAFCGVSTYTEQLATALANRRVDVRALSSDFRPRATESDVPCIVGWSEDGNLADAFSKIDEHHPKIVHIQHEHGIFRSTRALTKLCRAIQKDTSAKVIMTAHTVPKQAQRPGDDFARLIGQVDGLVVHSELCKEVIARYPNISETSKVHTIPHGMISPIKRVPRGTACMKVGLDPSRKVFRLLSMGFISNAKRHMAMLQVAMALVTRDQLAPRKLELVIVGQPVSGSSHLPSLIRKASKSMGIEQNVRVVEEFVPFEKLPYYYGAADMAIHMVDPANLSASGSMRTDLSHGVPIIATKSGMTLDLSLGVVKVGSTDEMMTRLVQVVKTPGVLRTLRDQAQVFAEQNSWSNIAAKHLALYEKVCKQTLFDRSQGVRSALFHSSPWLLGSGT